MVRHRGCPRKAPSPSPSLSSHNSATLEESSVNVATIEMQCQPTSNDFLYMDEGGIDPELKCSICAQPFEEPVSGNRCNHTFCKQCITTWLKNNKTCPICRCPVSLKNFTFINTCIVSNLLENLIVQCKHCNQTNIRRSSRGNTSRTVSKYHCCLYSVGH